MYQLKMAGQFDEPSSELRVDARRNQKRILLAAARLLADDPAASIQRIADEAQLARPTVYRRYPTREALIDAIAQEAIGEFATALDEAGAAGEDTASTLGRLIRALARIGADYPTVLQSAHAHDTASLVDRVDELIARGQAQGVIRADVTSDVLRHALFGALSASLRLARDPSARGLTADEIGAQVAAIIVDGLRSKPAQTAKPDTYEP
ncbi:TetR/AcrR family transcriptional regulator [Microbispora catharanthi]|uniref:TetR family transcriptional regulator n=1 Tax=Microbispora catharanthi TaxID=1712871 RepID=A0A5N6C5J0_9ACTN|nr:TetR/AcrR family transcriptional regulator [Microbispora catharanthi]KAB8188074.1 TetR family transcriptional regulator [Microbispora catharanthi]